MKYKCSICGYVYDEAKEGASFADLPDSWQCPLCGAPKSAFEPLEEAEQQVAQPSPPVVSPDRVHDDAADDSMQPLSMGQMAALCSNLARGCEKLYMPRESALFSQLADWFTSHAPQVNDATVAAVTAQLQQDIQDYPAVHATGVQQGDRGARRALTWSEKATRMLSSLMIRYQREGDSLLAGTDIWVCSVCGFVFIGQSAPERCPVCGVPSWKFNQTERRKQS